MFTNLLLFVVWWDVFVLLLFTTTVVAWLDVVFGVELILGHFYHLSIVWSRDTVTLETLPRTFISVVATAFTLTLATKESGNVFRSHLFKQFFRVFASQDLYLLSGFLIDEWFEYLPSCSEHEGTVDDQHGVHDLRVVILTHIDGTSHEALGLGIEHAHRKSLHV